MVIHAVTRLPSKIYGVLKYKNLMSLKLKQYILFIGQTLWLSFVATLLLVLIFLGIARLGSPLLLTQQALLKNGVSFLLDQPVQIGLLAITWQGFHPALQFKQVVIGDTEQKQPLIQIDEIDVNIGADLMSLIFTGQLRLDAHVENLNLPRSGKIPGINNLSGHLRLTPDFGLINIPAQKTQIDFGPMFKAPITFDQLSAHIIWQHETDGWLVKATHFAAQNNDGVAAGKMTLLIPNDHSSPIIDLSATTQMNSAQHLPNYLPLTVLHQGLIDWLTNSIVAVQNAQATVTLQGRLADFPYDHNNGTFRIDALLAGTELHFWPGWPTIHNMAGELIFAGRRMEVAVHSAQVFNTQLQNIRAVIPILKKGVLAMLNVDGEVTTTLTDALKFLRQSPLHQLESLHDFTGKGPVQLQLHLAIPVEKTEVKSSIQGQLELQNDTLTLPQWHLDLSDLQGQIKFTRDTIEAPKLTANLWNKPIKLAISTQDTARIQINYGDLSAKLSPPHADEGWSIDLQSPTVLGQITIPKNKQPLQINFQKLYLTDDTLQSTKQWSPKDIPAITLNVRDFRYGDKRFGQVQLQLAPLDDGVQITTLRATSNAFALNASGAWRSTKTGESTQINGTFTSPAIKDALASWGLPAGIAAKQSKVQFNLTWPGAAYNPAFNHLNGSFNLDIKQGQINDISTGTAVKINIGRLLNLLSIQSLMKDIQLDFSDLKVQGFSFDTLQGNFILRDGNAVTNDADIKGTVADVRINGRIGLAAKDYDLQLRILPNVTASLPVIVGIVAGGGPILGPIAGLATWAASKVFNPAVQTVTATTYRMTGPWSNPNIVKVSAAKK
jgi:uncharacterized protein YhdP